MSPRFLDSHLCANHHVLMISEAACLSLADLVHRRWPQSPVFALLSAHQDSPCCVRTLADLFISPAFGNRLRPTGPVLRLPAPVALRGGACPAGRPASVGISHRVAVGIFARQTAHRGIRTWACLAASRSQPPARPRGPPRSVAGLGICTDHQPRSGAARRQRACLFDRNRNDGGDAFAGAASAGIGPTESPDPPAAPPRHGQSAGQCDEQCSQQRRHQSRPRRPALAPASASASLRGRDRTHSRLLRSHGLDPQSPTPDVSNDASSSTSTSCRCSSCSSAPPRCAAGA